MSNYYLRRTAQAVFTVFAVISISFGLIRLMPGGPMDYVRAQLRQQSGNVNQAKINSMVELYTNVKPDAPLHEQYITYVLKVFQGDFGVSMWYNEPVAVILSAAIPWTLFVMTIALAFTFGIGIALGAAMAYAEGSRFDTVMSMASIFLNSIPYYVAAIILVYYLGYENGILPTGGRISSEVSPGLDLAFVQSAFYHAILPIASFVFTAFGIQALAMRGNSIRVLGEDYLRVARLRGLHPHEIAFRYIGRNAILPMYTGLMISVGFMFGGSVLLEEIFSYPGVGYYMFRGIQARDYPLMMGAFILITVAVVVGLYIADLTYGRLDPRASSGGGEREAY